ncbi:MAG: hypothetical protein LBO79_08415, partial [Zoogloeaceae bacterium]|nr:hypothetical protein [Zoogloeaceae bacterium]
HNAQRTTHNAQRENLLRYLWITEKIFRRLDNAEFFLSSSPAFPSPSGFPFLSGFSGFFAFPRFTVPVAGAFPLVLAITPHTAHRPPHNAQRTTHNAHRTTHNAQRTTHNAQRTTHNAQRTTHNMKIISVIHR